MNAMYGKRSASRCHAIATASLVTLAVVLPTGDLVPQSDEIGSDTGTVVDLVRLDTVGR